jgi:hypothetical protein
MESKKINQLATELAPELSDLTIIGDPTTGISKKITLSQMASLFTGTVEEYASLSAFPLVGTADTIYIALDTNILYRWNTGTSAYVELSPNVVSSLVFNDANGFDGTISLVGSVATLTITTALTQGSVPFIGASGALTQDNANLFFDDTNNRLGINTNSPTTALDVFGSGIIGRLNGTSTNNAFLGFASAGSNKWSIGNVQSDHRFRIYNEAATSELFTVLPTGEIGVGIANPLTKLHIDGGASALIANLDANVSVAKSVSFRSDNSSRFNIEVSGTESGSNAGMDLFIRRYSDAGALIDTPLTITRSTGAISLSTALSGTTASFSGALSSNSLSSNSLTLTSTQTNLVLNTTTNTSFSKLSFQDNGVEKGTLTYANSAFAATARRNKLEIANTGGINFITQNAPLSPDMIINSSGNVSIGNTNDTYKLDVSGTGRFSSNLTTNGLYLISGNALRTYRGANDYYWQINSDSNNFLNFGTYFANGTAYGTNPKLLIHDNGNVGIGINNPNSILDVVGSGGIRVNEDGAGTKVISIRSNFAGVDPAINVSSNNSLLLLTNNTERIRLTNIGTFDVKANNNNVNGMSAIISRLGSNCDNTSSYGLIVETGGANRCFIYGNGNIVNSNNSYGSISDIKLKENISDATEKLNDLLKVKVRNYNFIGNTQKQIGVIAQELEEVFPSMIDETEDFEEVEIIDEKGNKKTEKQSLGTFTKSVKYSVFVPILIKAIQELEARVKQLESK